MHPSSFHYPPLAPLFYLALLLLLLVAVLVIEVGLVHYASERLGIGRRQIFLLMLLCLLGSYINIPVAEFPGEQVVSGEVVPFFGVQYVVPVVHEWPGTILAVNVGGALIPTGLSIYLLVKHRLWLESLAGVAIVTAVVYWLATPVRGVGISVPVLGPPIIAALVAVLIGRRKSAPLAYVAGTLGTLIGADLLNLGAIAGLGAPVASIGGAGTFDGIFLTGILAMLLA